MPAQSAESIGKIDRAVFFYDEIVRSSESFSLVAIGQNGALAVFFNPVDGAACPCGDQQAALAVQSEPVRSDHEENIFTVGIRLRHADAPDVVAGVAAVIEVQGNFSIGREFVDHVRVHVAQEHVAGIPLVDPDDSFRESEIPFHEFELRIGRDESVESGVELHNWFVQRCLRP